MKDISFFTDSLGFSTIKCIRFLIKFKVLNEMLLDISLMLRINLILGLNRKSGSGNVLS